MRQCAVSAGGVFQVGPGGYFGHQSTQSILRIAAFKWGGLPERVWCRSVGGAGAAVSQWAQHWLFDWPGVFWPESLCIGLSGVQVGLLSQNSGCSVDRGCVRLSNRQFCQFSLAHLRSLRSNICPGSVLAGVYWGIGDVFVAFGKRGKCP